jgi:hypothetical protein
MFREDRDREIAMSDVALVITVGKPGAKLAQVAPTDWLATQRTEGFWTRPPAIYQNEFHIPSPPA